MVVNWNKAKDKLIKYYFPNDAYMQSVTEKAHMGEWKKQEELAMWFERHDYPELANVWNTKAKQIKKELGIEEEL